MACNRRRESMLVTRRLVARNAAVAVVELVVILTLSAPVHAQADNGWLGKRVVPKRADFRLRIGNQSLEPGKLAIYRVEELNGPWLRLKGPGEGTEGWAMADEIVPCREGYRLLQRLHRCSSERTRWVSYASLPPP